VSPTIVTRSTRRTFGQESDAAQRWQARLSQNAIEFDSEVNRTWYPGNAACVCRIVSSSALSSSLMPTISWVNALLI